MLLLLIGDSDFFQHVNVNDVEIKFVLRLIHEVERALLRVEQSFRLLDDPVSSAKRSISELIATPTSRSFVVRV